MIAWLSKKPKGRYHKMHLTDQGACLNINNNGDKGEKKEAISETSKLQNPLNKITTFCTSSVSRTKLKINFQN